MKQKISVGDAFKKRNNSSNDHRKGNQQKGFLLSQLRFICEDFVYKEPQHTL